MSCPFYWYNHHYACRKSEKDVDEDTYYRYCRDYSYDDCPIYKQQSSSGCFLTSACVDARGLSDDCHELSVLRAFRDDYLRSLPDGEAEIVVYYSIAPKIVAAIKQHTDSLKIFNSIYTDLVKPCVELIESGKMEAAHSRYRSYVIELSKKYLTA